MSWLSKKELNDRLRIAFVQGAKWREYGLSGATMWQSDQKLAALEADARIKNGTLGVKKT